jgi:hypothetical protein
VRVRANGENLEIDYERLWLDTGVDWLVCGDEVRPAPLWGEFLNVELMQPRGSRQDDNHTGRSASGEIGNQKLETKEESEDSFLF